MGFLAPALLLTLVTGCSGIHPWIGAARWAREVPALQLVLCEAQKSLRFCVGLLCLHKTHSLVAVASFLCKPSFASHFGYFFIWQIYSFLHFVFSICSEGCYSARQNKFIWNECTFLNSLPPLSSLTLPFPPSLLSSLPSFLPPLRSFVKEDSTVFPEPWYKFLYHNGHWHLYHFWLTLIKHCNRCY